MPKIGDQLPNFTLDSTVGPVALRKLKSKTVLYFYPGDDTPTCTRESCNFRDSFADFESAGVQVFGVSPNDIASHEKFRAKHKLPFPLIFDEDHKLAAALGIWVEKQMFGHKFMGVERTTLIVGKAGKIAAVFPKVRIRDHHLKVLEAARTLD
jgi:peroxiredoxin Q/BCP